MKSQQDPAREGDGDLSPVPTVAAREHPLDRFTDGGWAKGLLRLGVAFAIVGLVLALTGDETWGLLLRPENLPLLLLAGVLAGLQRVLQVLKWGWIVESVPLTRRTFAYLLRIQLIGLLANLLLPVSEALRVWAVYPYGGEGEEPSGEESSGEHEDRSRLWKRWKRPGLLVLAIETVVMDSALTSVAVGFLGLVGVAAMASSADPWLWAGAVGVALLSLTITLVVRYRPRSDEEHVQRQLGRPALVSLVEAVCLLLIHGIALVAAGVSLDPFTVAAIFPLLYLSHVVMVTPSGLGVREGLFAVIFAGLCDSPAEAGVAVALMISVTQLLVALFGGGLALVWPSSKRGTSPR